MQLSQLRAFVVAAQEKSFTRAAEKLYITQPTVTFRIHELETELGYPLFDRIGRSVELTQEGQRLLYHVEQALRLLDDGLKEVNRSKRSARHLALACIPVFGFYYLPALFSFIKSRGLPLDITLKTRRSSEEVLRFMKDGAANVGILNVNLVSLPRNFRALTLLEDTSCFVRGAAFPLPGEEPLPLRNLQEIPMVAYERGHPYWKMVEGFFATNNLRPDIIIEVDNFEIVKLLLTRGAGISVLPRIAIANELAAGTLAEIRTEPPLVERRKMCAVYPARKDLPEAVRMFLEALGGFLSQNPGIPG